MKKTYLLIVYSLVLSVSIVAILFIPYYITSHQKNGFVRNFPVNALTPLSKVDITYNSYYFAGFSVNKIYLGNEIDPRHVLIINHMLADSCHIRLRAGVADQQKFASPNISVDSPEFYMADGSIPVLLKGEITRKSAEKYKYDSLRFTESIHISQNLTIARAFDGRLNQYVLARETATEPHISFYPALLKRQVDGIFCTDGVLHYDREMKCIVYVYYYRNEFLCLDTNLNLVYTGTTIDTTTHAKVQVKIIASENSLMLSAPPPIVNKKCAVYGNLLFIYSNLKADNEAWHTFNKFAVIDIYDLKTHSYKFSFHVTGVDKEMINNFAVYQNNVFVLAGHELYKFSINASLLSGQVSKEKWF